MLGARVSTAHACTNLFILSTTHEVGITDEDSRRAAEVELQRA